MTENLEQSTSSTSKTETKSQISRKKTNRRSDVLEKMRTEKKEYYNQKLQFEKQKFERLMQLEKEKQEERKNRSNLLEKQNKLLQSITDLFKIYLENQLNIEILNDE